MYNEASAEVMYNYLSNHMDGLYFSGQDPPIYYPGVPYTAIIDMETGELALKDGTAQMSTSAILTYTEMLAED
ncbi:MAG: hypothetical protein R6V85_05240 [Polyangia bacterium]